ncbi:type VI secretion system protein TssA [Burkholderia pseudomallei]|uniref:type VI secretion system protein TssA n=1 Tax=Burkholderia pseudomallei TaxID=28450 RepID=UPI0009CF6940|nr:type VI secretion system protein TssA [Burkholderia pseudomallei]OND59518.1 type VI secretion system ImpA domain-containing protein [Burkholderia pseudomallei]OND61070.1 type VI secretion system ImpA domain-containing protein [Burkholderia pseudomallei]OND75102.1 type VI secretion system ImpA domain-containing protein [Burkholderia pseudomallei]WCE22481.1 type VI secretion system protein TssA [Burkholderia pseudomallei]WCK58559.1 type VI secretion system protein TssA [Burkholderia pseudomal
MGMSERRPPGGAAARARMPIDVQALAVLGRTDIDSAMPAGADVRADARFDALHAELAKLASPGASGQVDWRAATHLAAELLRERGKDLLVGCYLAGALLQTGGAAGLRCGLEIVGDLVERHWDAMSPPVSRMRARRGALQWLVDRVDAMHDAGAAACGGACSAELVAQLRAAARRIDALLAERDDDAPTMRAVHAFAERLPVEVVEVVAVADEADVAEATEATEAAETAETAETAEADAHGSMGGLAAEIAIAAAEQALIDPAGRAAPSAGTDTNANADAARQPSRLDEAAGRDRALADALAQLHCVATAFAQADWADARGFRLRRVACWSSVCALPETDAENGRTRIAAPSASIVGAAKNIDEDGEPVAAVRFAEAHAQAFPLWLDLQRIAARALARAGGDGADARREVETAVRALLARLPGLDALTFADGTPFADDATRAWLGELGAPVVAADAVSPSSLPLSPRPSPPERSSPMAGEPARAPGDACGASADDAVDRACAFAASGQLDLALHAIQHAIDRATSAEQRLRARVRLCELARDHWPHEVPEAFARGVIEPIRRHDLLAWNPELALDGLSAAYALLIRRDRESAHARTVLDEIASVDAARAMRLST